MKNNMTHLDSVMNKLVTFTFPIAYEDAVQAATDIVNLFYMNQRYCLAYKVWEDLNAACPQGDIMNCMDMEIILSNGKSNMFGIFNKVENIF